MDEKQEPQVVNLMDALKASLRVGEEIRTMSPSAQAAVRREALRSPAVTALLEAAKRHVALIREPIASDQIISQTLALTESATALEAAADAVKEWVRMSEFFLKDLEHVLNANIMERGSNTPDYILAEFLTRCLDAFNRGVVDREAWHVAVRKEAALGAFVRELWQLNPQWDVDDALQAVTDVANFIAEQEKP